MDVFINFLGRLGADAETVTTGSTSFISFRVAVDETVKKEQKTRWINVRGNLDSFKNMVKYLTKGKLVFVRGKENVNGFLTKSGEVGVDTSVWADGINFVSLGKPSDSQTQDEQTTNKDELNNKMSVTANTGNSATDADGKQGSLFDEPSDNIETDDLPF